MNADQVKGDWKQISGLIKQKWGKLTGDEVAVANGNLDIVAGKLQEHYGLTKEAAQTELKKLMATLPPRDKAHPYDKPEVTTEGAPVDSETLKLGMK